MARPSAGIFELKNSSAREIEREIARRERRALGLMRRRERLASRLRSIDEEIGRLGVSAASLNGRAHHTRFRNEVVLADALVETLSGKTLTVAQAMQEVQSNGYRTTAQNFRVMVNLALSRDKRIRRVARGRYTARARSRA